MFVLNFLGLEQFEALIDVNNWKCTLATRFALPVSLFAFVTPREENYICPFRPLD